MKRIFGGGGENGQQFEETRDAVLNGLVATLNIAKDASAAFPPLQSAVGGVAGIVDMLKKMRANVEQIEALHKYAKRLRTTLDHPHFKDGEACPEELRQRVDPFAKQLEETTQGIRKLASQHKISRFLSSDAHAGTIDEYIRQISWTINDFVIGGTIAIELGISNLQSAVDNGFRQVDARFDRVDGQLQGLGNRLADNASGSGPTPRYAIAARFDYASERVACEDHTRMETLATVYQWLVPDQASVGTPAAVLQQPKTDAPVFWLSGLAGTGKSTIAQTVAEWCADPSRNLLGASFFCSRANSECSNVQMIFPTIAYQLGQFFPEFQAKVAEVLRKDPHIEAAHVSRQLEHLIINPLREVPSFPRCGIVIDALDECKDNQATSLTVGALQQHVPSLGPLKIFLTSRPVSNITRGFRSTGLLQDTQHLILHEVPPNCTERDLGVFLQKRLTGVREEYALERSWPSDEQVSQLVGLSNRLFIYAATVIRYIEDVNASSPKNRLLSLLRGQVLSSDESTPFKDLDALYLQVLRTAYPAISGELRTRLKIVLGTLVLMRDRLSPAAIEQLLLLEPGTVRTTLTHLHSVVTVPEADGVVNLIHPSFQDFLVDERRCSDPNFLISPSIQQRLLAQRCIETMIATLHEDICGIGRSVPNSEVPQLPELIAKHISPALRYACLHWALHVSNDGVDSELFGLLDKFCKSHLLNWLEVLSLLGVLGDAVPMLQMLHEKLSELPLPHSDIPELLYDCQRATQQSFPGLSVSCLQAYLGIIPFCPTSSKLREHYLVQASRAPRLLIGLEERWDTCDVTMEGHTAPVTGVAFSPDGRLVISGALDRRVRLWNAVTGAPLDVLQGHEAGVHCVALSPDGKHIASGSEDRTIIIWDAVTGGHIRTLEGHTDAVNTLDFSPDSRTLASGSSDGSIQLWAVDSWNNPHVTISHAHSGGVGVVNVQFSCSGNTLVSCGGSYLDGCSKLWVASTGACSREIASSTHAIAIAPDETIIAFVADDFSLSLHSIANDCCLYTLRGHTDSHSTSLDFSPDGLILASGGSNPAITLWDVTSYSVLHIIDNGDGINSLRFSFDGRRLCGGGDGCIARIWDLSHLPSSRAKPPLKKQKAVQKQVSSIAEVMALSSDGRVLATRSQDHTICLWNASAGTHLQVLKGQNSMMSRLSFSPDGRKLASFSGGEKDFIHCSANGVKYVGSNFLLFFAPELRSAGDISTESLKAFDQPGPSTIRLWDVKKGRCEETFVGHESGILDTRFFPDGKQIISCGHDGSVRTWNVGQSIKQRIARSESRVVYRGDCSILSVAIRPDAAVAAFGSVAPPDPQEIASSSRVRASFSVGLVDLRTRQVICQIRCDGGAWPNQLAFSDDGSRLLQLSTTSYVPDLTRLYETQTAGQTSPTLTHMGTYDCEPYKGDIAFSPSGRFIVAGGAFCAVRLEHLPPMALQGNSPLSEDYAFFLSDDWLWYASANEQRRICWVPPSFRPRSSRNGLPKFSERTRRPTILIRRNTVTIRTVLKSLVILDTSPCLPRGC